MFFATARARLSAFAQPCGPHALRPVDRECRAGAAEHRDRLAVLPLHCARARSAAASGDVIECEPKAPHLPIASAPAAFVSMMLAKRDCERGDARQRDPETRMNNSPQPNSRRKRKGKDLSGTKRPSRRAPRSAPRRIDIDQRRVVLDAAPRPRPRRNVLMRWRAPTSPSIAIRSGKKRRAHSTGLPRLPAMVGITTSAPRSGSKAAISLSISAGVTCGMSPRRRPRRHRTSGGTARDAGLERGGQGRPRSPDCARTCTGKPGERALDLLALVAGDDDHRLRACEASTCSAAIRTSGWPLISSSSLFGPPMRVERPAASTTPAILLPFSGSRLVARLRPRHDLHQQAADTQPGDVGARDRQAREQARQHPVEAVFLRRARTARRAEHRLAVRFGRPAAGCRDRPACRNARCVRRSLSIAAGITSRRSAIADAPNTTTSSAPALQHLVERLRERACAHAARAAPQR